MPTSNVLEKSCICKECQLNSYWISVLMSWLVLCTGFHYHYFKARLAYTVLLYSIHGTTSMPVFMSAQLDIWNMYVPLFIMLQYSILAYAYLIHTTMSQQNGLHIWVETTGKKWRSSLQVCWGLYVVCGRFISDLNCAYNLAEFFNHELTCSRFATSFVHIMKSNFVS